MTIGGVRVDPLTYPKMLRFISESVRRNTRTYICVAAAHLIVECQNNPELRSGVNRAGLVTPDGMPLVWKLRASGSPTDRIYGPTLLEKVCNLAQAHAYQLFILGGSPGQSALVARTLRDRYPRLIIAGTLDTPGKIVPSSAVTKMNRSGARIVICGMGCPYQELWMIRSRKVLSAPVLIGVGAAFDFLTGYEKQAPPVIRNVGFEWLYRFLQHPRRLFTRYTLMNLRFLQIALGRAE